MNAYRIISLSFWTDSKIDDDFTPEDKYFYFYLLTNPHTTLCGCYEVSMKQMCRETGYNEDTVRRLLNRMEHQHHVIRYSAETKEVLIVNWSKYNWNNSSKTLAGVLNSAQNIKSAEFRAFIADKLRALGVCADTLSIGYPYPMDTSVSVSVSDSVSVTVSEDDKEEAINKDNARVHAGGTENSDEDKITPSAKKAETVERHKHGEYGWVRLTEDEYQKLVNFMGEAEFQRCLQYVDEAAEKTHNKNGWKNWYLVMRACHRDGWGVRSGGGRGGGDGYTKPFQHDYGNDADTLPF